MAISPVSLASSPRLDLSALPAPDIIPRLDYEGRRTAKLDKLVELKPDFTGTQPSDPAVKLIEADSYHEGVVAEEMGYAARGLMLAYAVGAQLDHLAARWDMPRLEITPANPGTGAAAMMESDDDFRRRIQLAPYALSTAGAEGSYVLHALGAHADVRDASAISPAPAEVEVAILSRTGTGIPAGSVLTAVEAALSAADVRPLGDRLTVRAAEILNVPIEANLTLFAGPDSALIMQTAQESLAAWLAAHGLLGNDVPRSALIAALHVGGVQKVELISPAADVEVAPHQAARASIITLNNIGSVV